MASFAARLKTALSVVAKRKILGHFLFLFLAARGGTLSHFLYNTPIVFYSFIFFR